MKQKITPSPQLVLKSSLKVIISKKGDRIIPFVFLIFSICIFNSCQKELSKQDSIPERIEIDPSKVYKNPSTSEEKALVGNLVKVTEVFKELYKDKTNLKLVNAAIFSRAYTDESVLLKDLIFPQNSRLNSFSKFREYAKKFNVTLNDFSNNFWNVANKTTDQSFLQFLNKLNVKSSSALQRAYNEDVEEVSIYFPYSEEFNLPKDGGYYEPITSLATATADADEGWGSQPYYIDGVFKYYKQVLINDDFAELNPLQIIGINGIEPDNDFGNPISGAFLPTGPKDLPGFTREVKQVYIGEVRCKKRHDALISFTGNGGGNEMVFTRADGFLKVADGQVQADNYSTPPKTIKRRDIRKENFVDFSFEWDGDWELTNLQQNMAIYEDDNRNSSEISGSLSTTLKDPTSSLSYTGTIGFKITFKSDDAIIRQINLNRGSFFALNRTNLEGEMRNGWPVRDRGANTSYTLMDRTFF